MISRSSFSSKTVAAFAIASVVAISSLSTPNTAEAGRLGKVLGIGLAVGAGALIINELNKQNHGTKHYKRHHYHDGYSHKHKYTYHDHSHGSYTSYSKPKKHSYSKRETRRIQIALNDWGFYAGHPDGVSGPQIRRAIRDFQSYLGAKRTCHLTSYQKRTLLN